MLPRVFKGWRIARAASDGRDPEIVHDATDECIRGYSFASHSVENHAPDIGFARRYIWRSPSTRVRSGYLNHVPTEGLVPDTEKLRCVHGLDLVGQAQSARPAPDGEQIESAVVRPR